LCNIFAFKNFLLYIIAHFREKLENLLKKWYGTPEHTDLVREDMSDNEAESEEEVKTPKKKWTKKEAT
jgi:hypothetical protein